MPDLERLRAAGSEYRRAVEALGVAWPSPAEGDVNPPPRPAEYHGIAEVPEEIRWLHSSLAAGPLGSDALPDGGWLLPWPTSAREALEPLQYYGAMPFHWCSQIPLFNFESLVFTLAADDAHAGEVWRYEIGSESRHPLRAAPDLATVLENWALIAARDGFFLSPYDDLLRLRSDGDDDEQYLRTLGVDPFSYPVEPLDTAEITRRQQADGVDPARAEDCGVWEATYAEIGELGGRLDG